MLNLSFDSENELTIKITDMENERFYLPYQDPFPFTKVHMTNGTKIYDILMAELQEAFWVSVFRVSTHELVFDTEGL